MDEVQAARDRDPSRRTHRRGRDDGEKVGGITVNIGARIGGMAHPSEVLVSQTVKDLVAGSGLQFEDRGEHVLQGIPGSWRFATVPR